MKFKLLNTALCVIFGGSLIVSAIYHGLIADLPGSLGAKVIVSAVWAALQK